MVRVVVSGFRGSRQGFAALGGNQGGGATPPPSRVTARRLCVRPGNHLVFPRCPMPGRMTTRTQVGSLVVPQQAPPPFVTGLNKLSERGGVNSPLTRILRRSVFFLLAGNRETVPSFLRDLRSSGRLRPRRSLKGCAGSKRGAFNVGGGGSVTGRNERGGWRGKPGKRRGSGERNSERDPRAGWRGEKKNTPAISCPFSPLSNNPESKPEKLSSSTSSHRCPPPPLSPRCSSPNPCPSSSSSSPPCCP